MTENMYGTSSGSQATVTGFFDTRNEAEAAATRLRDLGLGVLVEITEGSDAGVSSSTYEDDNRGFFEKLGDFFFPDDDRYTYAEGLSRGGYLLVASNVASENLDRVADELEDAGAVNVDERAESWRAEGWSGRPTHDTGHWSETSQASFGTTSGAFVSNSETASTGSVTSDDDGSLEGSVPVVEERLRVGKRDVSHGRVRIRSYVVEEPVSETVRLASEHVEVERRRVDRPVTGADADLFRERTIEAVESHEEAVVSKEARVVEEIGLRHTQDSRDETISDTVRRTEVEIDEDREGSMSDSLSDRSGMSEFEAETGVPPDDEDDLARRSRRDRDS